MNDRNHDGSLSGNEMVDSWEAKTMTWDQVGEVVESVSDGNQSDYVTVNDVELINGAVDSQLRLQVKGKDYQFSKGSFDQLGNFLGGLGCRLAGQGQNDNERQLIGQLYVSRFESFKKDQPNKQLFLRTRTDNTDYGCVNSCRAILTGGYKPLDNRWIVDQLRNERPDAMIRFGSDEYRKGGGDCLKLELLDRSSMRALVDAGGGFGDSGQVDNDICGSMIAVSNNEVGRGRFSLLPSVYRCLCANGAIMGASENKELSINMVHRGRLDLDHILNQVVEKLGLVEKSFDVGMRGMEVLKNERPMLEGVTEEQLLMLCGRGMKNTKTEQMELFRSFGEEEKIMRMGAWSCFNAITRWAQTCDDLGDMQLIELAGGKLLSRWQNQDSFILDCKNAASVDVSRECLFLSN